MSTNTKSTKTTKFQKRDKIYFENAYLRLLEKLKTALENKANSDPSKNPKDAELKETVNKSKANIDGFFKKGESGKADVKKKATDQEKRFAKKEALIYKKFSTKNKKYWIKTKNNERTVDQEIRRIKNGKYVRFIGKVLVVGGLATAVILCATKCSSKKNTASTTTSDTNVTDTNLTDSTTTTDNSTTETTTPSTSNSTSTTTNSSDALESMDDEMKGIVIINGTTATTAYEDNSNGYGNNGNGGYNGGNSNNGGYNGGNTSSTTTTTPTTTSTTTSETTKATESTTTTTVTQPTINTDGETVPTTSVVTEPAYSESNDGKDVVENQYDGKNPSYIEEDPTQTYETFFTFPLADYNSDVDDYIVEQSSTYTLTLSRK